MEDRGGEQRQKIEKNRKFGNQKVSEVVGKKKKKLRGRCCDIV